jgi:nitrate/nitrite transporter NarK
VLRVAVQLDCLSTESYPTTLRTTGMAVLAGAGRLGSVAGQFVFSWLIDVSVAALLLTAAGMLFLGVLALSCVCCSFTVA